jgi:hypothetical protein
MEFRFSDHDDLSCILEWKDGGGIRMIMLDAPFLPIKPDYDLLVQVVPPDFPRVYPYGNYISSFSIGCDLIEFQEYLLLARDDALIADPTTTRLPPWLKLRDNRNARRNYKGPYRDVVAQDTVLLDLKSEEEYIRYATAISLGDHGDELAIGPLTDVLEDPSERVRIVAKEAIAKIRDAYSLP